MAEKTFFDDGGIKVTQARFIVPGQTYAMSGVTSVATRKITPSKTWPIILTVVGFFVMIGGFSAKSVGAGIVGLLILAGGIAWLLLQKPTYWVALHSASGEARALGDKNEAHIEAVIKALNDAIVARG